MKTRSLKTPRKAIKAPKCRHVWGHYAFDSSGASRACVKCGRSQTGSVPMGDLRP